MKPDNIYVYVDERYPDERTIVKFAFPPLGNLPFQITDIVLEKKITNTVGDEVFIPAENVNWKIVSLRTMTYMFESLSGHKNVHLKTPQEFTENNRIVLSRIIHQCG